MTTDTTSTPSTTQTRCALCGTGDATTDFVVAGLTFCGACHDRLTAAVLRHVEDDVARTRRPPSYFVSALVFVPGDGSWVVHLHTLQPGLVVGKRGETADRIRRSLVEVTGDEGLRLNVVPHEVFGCQPASAPEPSHP